MQIKAANQVSMGQILAQPLNRNYTKIKHTNTRCSLRMLSESTQRSITQIDCVIKRPTNIYKM